MHNKSTLIILLLALSLVSYSQISLKFFNYRPTGELGFVMKPAISAEISYMNPLEEDRLRPNLSLMVLNLKPRMDVFPTYVVQSGGSGTYIYPSEQSFQKFFLIKLYCGADYSVYETKKIFFYIGGNLLIGATTLKYTSMNQIIQEDYTGGGYIAGFRFKTGVEYKLNKNIFLFVNANRELFMVTEPPALYSANDYGLGIIYNFK